MAFHGASMACDGQEAVSSSSFHMFPQEMAEMPGDLDISPGDVGTRSHPLFSTRKWATGIRRHCTKLGDVQKVVVTVNWNSKEPNVNSP